MEEKTNGDVRFANATHSSVAEAHRRIDEFATKLAELQSEHAIAKGWLANIEKIIDAKTTTLNSKIDQIKKKQETSSKYTYAIILALVLIIVEPDSAHVIAQFLGGQAGQ